MNLPTCFLSLDAPNPLRSGSAMSIRRRHFSLACLGFTAGLVGCNRSPRTPTSRLTIGIISYGDGARSVEQYAQFNQILAEAIQGVIELEPAFNERKALDQLERQAWSLVFASPGLTAIAIDQYRYIPLFPRPGTLIRSVLIVQEESEFQSLSDLSEQSVALGQVGSATGYYLPLYDLYGLTLDQIRFASTPRQIVEWVETGEVMAGALSRSEFDALRRQGSMQGLRVLHTSRPIPPGSLLLGPMVERNLQKVITQTLNEIPPNIAEEVGYIPNADPPDYQYLIDLVNQIRPLEDKLGDQPVRLFGSTATSAEAIDGPEPVEADPTDPIEEIPETAL